MANYVMNLLSLHGSEEKIADLFAYVKSADTIFDFNKIMPIDIDGPEDLDNHLQHNTRIDKQRNLWGTKSNANDVEVDNEQIEFYTAWSPPISVIARLAELFPELTISHKWSEESLGINCGEIVYTGSYYEKCIPDNYSSTAYSIYVECWGDSECLYLDENACYIRKVCEKCGGC